MCDSDANRDSDSYTNKHANSHTDCYARGI